MARWPKFRTGLQPSRRVEVKVFSHDPSESLPYYHYRHHPSISISWLTQLPYRLQVLELFTLFRWILRVTNIVPQNVIGEADLRVTGLEEVERRLKCDDGVEKELTKYWSVSITILEVGIYICEHQEF